MGRICCYSEGEGVAMRRSQELRGRVLRPVLEWLGRVRPGHVTLASLLAGLAFCPLLIWGHPVAAMVMLVVHVVLDGVDGPLARHLGTASDRGSFTDTMADQLVVAFSTVAMIQAGLVSLWPGVVYLFFYTLVVVFAFVRNALAVPYSWLVRPRFVVYACIPVALYGWPPVLDVVMWASAILLGAKVLTGFVRIRQRM